MSIQRTEKKKRAQHTPTTNFSLSTFRQSWSTPCSPPSARTPRRLPSTQCGKTQARRCSRTGAPFQQAPAQIASRGGEHVKFRLARLTPNGEKKKNGKNMVLPALPPSACGQPVFFPRMFPYNPPHDTPRDWETSTSTLTPCFYANVGVSACSL